VGVGADERVGIGEGRAVVLLAEDDAGEVFEVHLVDDAGAGRDGAKVMEGVLGPAQQGVALAVAVVFEQHILFEGLGGAELVDLHGVVDDEIDGDEGIGLAGVGAGGQQGVAHGGEVDDAGHAGEVLEQDAGGHELDFVLRPVGLPAGDILDVGLAHDNAVFLAEQVLEQDFDGVGNAAEVETGRRESAEAMDLIVAARGPECGRTLEGVLAAHVNRRPAGNG
jgi:hypothetical protein